MLHFDRLKPNVTLKWLTIQQKIVIPFCKNLNAAMKYM